MIVRVDVGVRLSDGRILVDLVDVGDMESEMDGVDVRELLADLEAVRVLVALILLVGELEVNDLVDVGVLIGVDVAV